MLEIDILRNSLQIHYLFFIFYFLGGGAGVSRIVILKDFEGLCVQMTPIRPAG